MTVDCPLDCEHLAASRKFDKPAAPPGTMLHEDIRVSDEFLRENWQLATATGRILLLAASMVQSANDYDVRDALDAMIRTYRTRESGLVYDTRPSNPMAGAILARFEQELAQLREDVARQTGVHSIRDKDVLGVLVFWARTEQVTHNGRRQSKAFIQSLQRLMPAANRQEPEALIQG